METLYDRLLEICRDQGIENPRPKDISKLCEISSGRPKQIQDKGSAAKLGAKSLQILVNKGYAPAWVQNGTKPKFLSEQKRLIERSTTEPENTSISPSSSSTDDNGVPEFLRKAEEVKRSDAIERSEDDERLIAGYRAASRADKELIDFLITRSLQPGRVLPPPPGIESAEFLPKVQADDGKTKAFAEKLAKHK